MEQVAALKIIRQLANGIDPHSGEIFRSDSPYQHPDTVRALFLALRALENQPAPKQDAAVSTTKPQKSGKPWSDEEDKALAAAFDAGKQIPELAAQYQRSHFAIEARLAKLGKIAPPANLRGPKAASGAAAYIVKH
jgi:LmbE family N-acetylglucosaminyl deacetylase